MYDAPPALTFYMHPQLPVAIRLDSGEVFKLRSTPDAWFAQLEKMKSFCPTEAEGGSKMKRRCEWNYHIPSTNARNGAVGGA
jgi:hypothetical protein